MKILTPQEYAGMPYLHRGAIAKYQEAMGLLRMQPSLLMMAVIASLPLIGMPRFFAGPRDYRDGTPVWLINAIEFLMSPFFINTAISIIFLIVLFFSFYTAFKIFKARKYLKKLDISEESLAALTQGDIWQHFWLPELEKKAKERRGE